MEQHPVPQNISSYQFHLVGDMTLKQFLEVAGGVLIGVLVYATNLPGIIKWPLILFFASMGAALAFVPLEERPLEQWIVAFFRSVYSPTLFHWQKEENVKYFADETTSVSESTAPSSSAFSKIPFLNKLEEGESSYLSKLAGIFSPTTATTPTPITKPIVQADTAPVQTTIPQATQRPHIEHPVVQPQIISDARTTMITTSMMPNENGSVLTAHFQGGATPNMQAPAEVKKGVQIPQTTYISMDKGQRPQVVVQEVHQQPQGKIDLTPITINPVSATYANISATHAQFSVDAAPPSVPTVNNTISGQIMDSKGKIIEGAILEVVDETGRPVRALRSNKAGHFLIVTPLSNGKYKILIEKEGFNFEPIDFSAEGTIIQPIAIHAK